MQLDVKSFEYLLSEKKENVKIKITPHNPYYTEIYEQLKNANLTDCLYEEGGEKACYPMYDRIDFIEDKISFCACGGRDFHGSYPKISYEDTAEKTIESIIKTRARIINELNDRDEINYSRPCIGCPSIKKMCKYEEDEKIKLISLAFHPAPCQAKCIYCWVYKDKNNTKESVRASKYPKMILNIIQEFKKRDMIVKNCEFVTGAGEITILPYKDEILNEISAYKTTFDTNAFIYEQRIADSMKNNESAIYVSIDSGTRETFELIKGADKFYDVIENLKKYNKSGTIMLKCIMMPGLNDNNEDIIGIVNILNDLYMNYLHLSYDRGLPLRSTFYSYYKYYKILTSNKINMKFNIPSNINLTQAINYYTNKIKMKYERRNDIYKTLLHSNYKNNYSAIRAQYYHMETIDLIKCFKKGTRFALIGNTDTNFIISNAFKKLDIPLQTHNVPYKESFKHLKDKADIFICFQKTIYNDLCNYANSLGNYEGRIINIEDYYFSFEPAKTYILNHKIEECEMFANLHGKNVICFGAGKIGKKYLNKLLSNGIVPNYFVDNKSQSDFIRCDETTGRSGALFKINKPVSLLSENKDNLQILITATAPIYDEIKLQLIEMEMEQYIYDGEETSEDCICIICGNIIPQFLPFVSKHYTTKNVRCPICNSFKRHRALYYYMNENNLLSGLMNNKMKLLHFAPEKCLYDILNVNKNIDYWPVDFITNTPNIRANVDITEIPYKNDMFDLIICSHVLERIPDDIKAMKELLNVLKPSGVAFLNVPPLSTEPTHENLNCIPKEQTKCYGQSEPVRRYGMDYTERLKTAGFSVEVIDVCENMSKEEIEKYGFDSHDRIFKCTK